ncbi:TIGR03936 family radical SAM-associated protein [Spirochaeta thermophila]|uniref:Radical SAM core domain-containing protein n=1 Tax=Winmispira thermophila (strain ATCC 49972 / DSM 6192 / RI 19.B1) TaxID=665571 RepID=E0RSP8_WINT6|nr:TIGR03936 family radical SAM-associated protein [Spirochaeta thermophila]ADN02035.1 hypothetical protein STHERM_c10900 [Spirochaeta thermophila DSM 6192]
MGYAFDRLKKALHSVRQPGRYVGGEYGAITEEFSPDDLTIAICFPDLYEIGMSNTAIYYLYDLLNRIPGVHCERVFAPAPDFERSLSDHGLLLYGLETRTPLREFDIVAISVGYELGFTNIATILRTGGVAVEGARRSLAGDPVILMGGPGATNPLPFASLVDAVFVGEFEAIYPDLLYRLRDEKRKGGDRDTILQVLGEDPHVWMPGKQKAKRAIWMGFGEPRIYSYRPVPNIPAVQDHAVVEIMRGCPQGCRFCHAGIFYRPQRVKPPSAIHEEVRHLHEDLGYREITLASLSSGDYPGIFDLVRSLNREFAGRHLSFALPSLKVSTFALELLEEIGRGKKSGLTFAVETPYPEGQKGLNKEVELEKVISILQRAKEEGWRLAKFYFMIGLPHSIEDEREPERIVEYIETISRATRISIHVNIGTFVPKPHTPFQWAPQLSYEEAKRRIFQVRDRLKRYKWVKVGFHNPLQSVLEGLLSRGDERVGGLFLEAWERGARFEAWDEYLNEELWMNLLEREKQLVDEVLGGRPESDELPWGGVDLGVGRHFLTREWKRAQEGEMTAPCDVPCDHACGVCSRKVRLKHTHEAPLQLFSSARAASTEDIEIPSAQEPHHSDDLEEVLIFFVKKEGISYIPHRAMLGVFERSFIRAGMRIEYSRGFSPHPRMEFLRPLPVAVSSLCEVVRLRAALSTLPDPGTLSDSFPPGIDVWGIVKKDFPGSLTPLYAGEIYRLSGIDHKELEHVLKTIQHSEKGPSLEVLSESCLVDDGILLYVPVEGGANLKALLSALPPHEGLAVVREDIILRDAGRCFSVYDLPGHFSLQSLLWRPPRGSRVPLASFSEMRSPFP